MNSWTLLFRGKDLLWFRIQIDNELLSVIKRNALSYQRHPFWILAAILEYFIICLRTNVHTDIQS